ncbi:TcfC E-set like domain-containing protein [Dongshaea marina]|uniref:TcfC E-set like domain-containing protein n=1 Tax=Dongshaea marina TaxID=2047966 RepID=UPI000D3E2772|nr:TcfC E-set like domain-containing protein [Dongshaea marina]
MKKNLFSILLLMSNTVSAQQVISQNINVPSLKISVAYTSAPQEGNDNSPFDWSAIPKSFQNEFKTQGFPISISYSGNDMGVHIAHIKDKKLSIESPNKLLKKLPLSISAKKYMIDILENGFIANKPIICSNKLINMHVCTIKNQQLILVKLSLDTLKAKLILNKSLFKTQIISHHNYLPPPEKNYLSSVMQYSLNSSKTFGDSNNTSTSSLALTNTTGYSNTHAIASGYLSHNEHYNDYVLSSLKLIHNNQKSVTSLNYGNGTGIFGSSSSGMNYGYGGKVIAASWYSSNSLLLDKSQQSLNPIIIFVPRHTTARIYKDGTLLSVQHFDIGSHQLDTSNFPSGVYPVKIDLLEGGKVTGSRTEIINKPFDLSTLSPNLGIAYSLWGGIASQKDDSEFDMPYFGGSLRRVMSPHLFSSLNLYQIGQVSVVELDNQLALPENIRSNINAGADAHGGFAFTGSLQKSFGSMLNISLLYNHVRKNSHFDYSPFDFESNNINLNASIFMAQYGTLSLNNTYDIQRKNMGYNASYMLNLYSGHGFFIQGNISASWDNDESIIGSPDQFNYFYGLTLTHVFNDNSSVNSSLIYNPNQKTFSADSSYSLAADNKSFITNGSIGVSHRDNADMVSGSLSMDRSYLQGAINASAIQNDSGHNTQSLASSLSGSIAVSGGDMAFSHNTTSDSGIIFDLESPENVKMILNINGSHYPVSTGINFIPLTRYSYYDVYLMNSNENKDSLWWKSSDDSFVLYPGQIYHIKRKVIPTIQVVGQIVSHNTSAPYAKIDNHLSSEHSDAQGYFMIGINKSSPKLAITLSNGKRCSYQLSKDKINNIHNGSWIGKVLCNGAHSSSHH